ncbi:putative amidase, partial [Gordonia effusa NBRC 100432]
NEVSPEEIHDAAIARCRSVAELHAFTPASLDPAAVLPSQQGFFTSVPTAVKDMVRIAGMPTTQGSDAWRPTPARKDGPFVRHFRALGFSILGTSRMSEFGFLPTTEHPRLGAVPNPWNTALTAGGSSSGAAALVASGALPLAHAVDGGGSIRIPAACTGLYGLKPTRRRLPLDSDLRHTPIQIAQNGVLTRSVRDTAAFYREMEKTYRPRRLRPIGDITGPSARRLRIAVCTASPTGDASPEVRNHIHEVAAALSHFGHHVDTLDELALPPTLEGDFLAFWSLAAFLFTTTGRRRYDTSFDPGRLDPFTIWLAEKGKGNLRHSPIVTARLRRARQWTTKIYNDYDVLLTPTLAASPPQIGHLDPYTVPPEDLLERVTAWVRYTPLQNITGEPSMSIPTGRSADGGHIGSLISAAHGDDATLLHLAYELDRIYPWHPPLPTSKR